MHDPYDFARFASAPRTATRQHTALKSSPDEVSYSKHVHWRALYSRGLFDETSELLIKLDIGYIMLFPNK